METKFYVHGVTEGQEIWGINRNLLDEEHLKRYYDFSDFLPMEEQFVIDLLTMENGEIFCYYTFLKNKNVSNYEGRGNGYFAMTIRTDFFYPDWNGLYDFFQKIYEKKIVGSCIQKEKNGIRFTIKKLREKEKDFNQIGEFIDQYIELFYHFERLVPFNEISLEKRNKLKGSISSLDLKNCNTLDLIKKYCKIFISPSFLTKKDREIEGYEKKITELNALIQSKEQEIESLTKWKNAEVKGNNESKEKLSEVDNLLLEAHRIIGLNTFKE